MSETFQRRAEFIALLDAICRESDCPSPDMLDDANQPLAVEIDIEDVTFDIIHLPQPDAARLTVQCLFGTLPQGRSLETQVALLQANHALIRSREAVLGIDGPTDNVTYSFSQHLDEVRADSLLRNLALAAQRAREWRSTFYLDRMPTARNDISQDFPHVMDRIGEPGCESVRQQFLALMNDACAALDVAGHMDVSSGEDGVAVYMKTEGMSFTAMHAAGMAAQFVLEADIGPVPEDSSEAALRWFLRLNHDLAAKHGAMFAIDAATDHVLCLWPEDIAGQSGETLREKMIEISGLQAMQWNGIRIRNEDVAEISHDAPHASLESSLAFA